MNRTKSAVIGLALLQSECILNQPVGNQSLNHVSKCVRTQPQLTAICWPIRAKGNDFMAVSVGRIWHKQMKSSFLNPNVRALRSPQKWTNCVQAHKIARLRERHFQMRWPKNFWTCTYCNGGKNPCDVNTCRSDACLCNSRWSFCSDFWLEVAASICCAQRVANVYLHVIFFLILYFLRKRKSRSSQELALWCELSDRIVSEGFSLLISCETWENRKVYVNELLSPRCERTHSHRVWIALLWLLLGIESCCYEGFAGMCDGCASFTPERIVHKPTKTAVWILENTGPRKCKDVRLKAYSHFIYWFVNFLLSSEQIHHKIV